MGLKSPFETAKVFFLSICERWSFTWLASFGEFRPLVFRDCSTCRRHFSCRYSQVSPLLVLLCSPENVSAVQRVGWIMRPSPRPFCLPWDGQYTAIIALGSRSAWFRIKFRKQLARQFNQCALPWSLSFLLLTMSAITLLLTPLEFFEAPFCCHFCYCPPEDFSEVCIFFTFVTWSTWGSACINYIRLWRYRITGHISSTVGLKGFNELNLPGCFFAIRLDWVLPGF